MTQRIGFDSEQYLEEQTRYIQERLEMYDKLYLEFGGKLIGDLHAMRVLPGFDPDAKVKILQRLKDDAEVLICVYAGDIEQNKIRGDYGITYDEEVMRMMDDFKRWGLQVNSVIITRYNNQPAAQVFINRLRRRNVKVYTHAYTEGYPLDVDLIVSSNGYGRNEYIETERRLVVVTAPGPNSGKLATCLSQLYHETQRGHSAGYSKFETFPIWNLPLKHPVNVAYEAATADLMDVNMIDPYHLEAFGVSAVNYNRDIEAFPLLRRIMMKIYGEDIPFHSPTEMGVNRVGFCITDDDVVREAANQEIIRRAFHLACDFKKGLLSPEVSQRGKLLMDEMQLKEEDRSVVRPAREYAKKLLDKPSSCPNSTPQGTALELPDGSFVTGKGSSSMTSISACLLNAVKKLAGLADPLHLLSPVILKPLHVLKEDILGQRSQHLDAKEILIALSISAATNPMAEAALNQLKNLRGCQAHSTVIPSKADDDICRKLGIELTADPTFSSSSFYYDN
mgnify:CR=1 FL=1